MKSLQKNETGVALITAILVLMLASGLMAGMFAALIANQRTAATDRDQSVAYAAAHAGLEKLTAGLAALFSTDFSPSAAQIAVVDSTPPAIPGFSYTAPGGAVNSGYDITFTPDPGPGPNTGNPLALPSTDITTGPFEGFKGLITPYTLTVTARSTTGNSEVRLRRELQTVAVPVFQFGIFGEKSLGFHAGPPFDFGGRVHTNQSLFVAAGTGNTLTFRDKITAFTQVVRHRLSNGELITTTNHTGNVSIPTIIGGAAGTYRLLASTENSGLTTAPCIASGSMNSNCWTGWKNLSEVTYRTNIRTEATGAKQLNLPLTSAGLGPIELIRRPVVNSNENVANAVVYGQRYYAQASLRILLSDRAADITNLPGLTATAPVELTPAALAAAGYAGRPVPLSPGPEPVSPGGAHPLAAGLSTTRMSSVAAAGPPATLNVQNHNGANWVNGVPPWMRWTNLTASWGANVVTLSCTHLNAAGTQLQNCNAAAYLPALAIPNGSTITFTPWGGGPAFTATTNGNTALNNATINLVGAVNLAQLVVATRGFFVGNDPVHCTGFTATTLTGCTFPGAPTATLDNNDPIYSGATTTAGTPLLSGFIKIERQNAAGVWSDVTMELLNLGMSNRNEQGDDCGDPTNTAVIRLMHLRDNGYTGNLCGAGGAYDYSASVNGTDYAPNMLYDAREGHSRLQATDAGMHMGGLFSYVALDVNNFRRWVAGTIGATGNQTLNNNGYIIYFSDRRGDHNEAHATVPDIETGEFGHEDSINPAAAAWAQNNALDVGEDFNENNTLETYGATPHPLAVPATAVANLQFDATQRPWTEVIRDYSGRGRLARPVLFRRALKIINGGIDGAGNNQIPASGLTITSENPVYVFGDYNATPASVTAEPNVPAAIIGDSITLLSSAFRDSMTFVYPNDQANRDAVTTSYRFAMVTGKTIPFPKPGAWGVNELGSDGGVHNFMKMLENWGGQTLRYRGSMVSLYYSRQAIGIYRADANIYGAPTRGYNFDTDFLSPPLLPPGTPMFRDINTLKFRQILRPNQ